jgi:predicted metalloprotease
MPLGVGGVLLLLVLSWATGIDFTSVVNPGDGAQVEQGDSRPVESSPEETREAAFVDAVMGDVQNTWRTLLPGDYQDTKVRLFRDAVNSGCGVGQAATGPFYCPADQHVYLDLSFFDELRDRFGAAGDFARAYVIAHEVGHHVQRLTGIEGRMRGAQRDRPGAANQLSVQLELQADCLAGVWGHAAAQSGRSSRGLVELEEGDVEEGLNAAAAIGDDRLQRMSGKSVAPESFTHGSSAQRVEWFKRGLTSGNPDACNTFGRSAS